MRVTGSSSFDIQAFLSKTCLVLVLSPVLSAQYTSGVEGTVTDQSGAAVPAAQVRLTNEATQVRKEATTNERGFFRISDLLAGSYRVEVTHSGFQPWIQSNVLLEGNQMRTVYPQLSVGEQKSIVEVTADIGAVETGKSTVARSIEQKTVEEAPMLGRNIYGGVAALAPGITGAGALFGGATGSGSVSQDSFQTEPGFQINAAGQRHETNEYQVDGASVNGNSRDGIVNLTPQPDTVAEVRVAAATFSADKGRNSGALIEVYTKSGTNQFHGSISEFHTNNVLTARTVFQTGVPVFRRNEYGFTLGGPVIKDRTFLFGSYYRLSSSAGQTDVVRVETPQFRDWLARTYPNSIALKIFTEAPPGAYPISNFQTAGQIKSQSYFPNPDIPDNLPVIGTAYINQSLARPAGQWNIRMDHNFRNYKDRIYANYFNYFSEGQQANPRPLQRIVTPNYGMYGKVNWTHAFTPGLLNEASAALVRVDGMTPPTAHKEFPNVGITGTQGFSQNDISWLHENWNWHEVLSWMRGNHNLRFGADVDRQADLDNFTISFARPSFTFASLLDFAQDKPISQTGPTVDTATQTLAQNLYPRIYMTYVGSFVQDDWKVRKNLTLNLGLRWDYFGRLARADRGGTPYSFFTPGQGATFADQITKGYMRTTGDGLVTTKPLWGFTPRFGFGWDVFSDGSHAIRGGWGMFLNRIANLSYTNPSRSNPPAFGRVENDVLRGQPIAYALGSPDGRYFPLPPGVQFKINEVGGLVGTLTAVGGVDPEPDPPRVQVWNIAVQKKLPGGFVLEGDYLGTTGRKLYLQTEVNRFPGDLVQDRVLNRLNPYFGSVIHGQTIGVSDAHYGSVMLSRRFSRGLSARGIYTFGKATDLTSSNDNGVGGGRNVFNGLDVNGQHGRADYHVGQRLSIDSVWEVPSPWKSGWKGNILGNWRLAGIAIFQSGRPFTVVSQAPFPTGDFNGDGFNWDSPNTPAFGNSVSSERSDFINGLFLASDFPRPPSGQQGNLGRNTFDGPGLANVNLNVIKAVKIPWFLSESATLELRGEIFNLFNRVNLTPPVADLSNGLFGRSTSQTLPRAVTFGLRIQF